MSWQDEVDQLHKADEKKRLSDLRKASDTRDVCLAKMMYLEQNSQDVKDYVNEKQMLTIMMALIDGLGGE